MTDPARAKLWEQGRKMGLSREQATDYANAMVEGRAWTNPNANATPADSVRLGLHYGGTQPHPELDPQPEPVDPREAAKEAALGRLSKSRLPAAVGGVADFALMAGHGGTLGLLPRLVGAALPGVSRDDIQQRVDDLRATSPGASMAGEVAGGVASGVAAGAALAGRGAAAGLNTLRGVAATSTAGGAVAGASEADNLGEAVGGATVGGLSGALLGPLAFGVGRGVGNLLRGPGTRAVDRAEGLLRGSGTTPQEAVEGAWTHVEDGKPATLADMMGQRGVRALRGARAWSPAAGEQIDEALSARMAGQEERILGDLAETTGLRTREGLTQTAEDIGARQRQAAAPLYDEAFSETTDPLAGTRVVDPATGQPRVVYHGTPRAFDEFDLSRSGEWPNGRGVHFAEDPAHAEGFALSRRQRPDGEQPPFAPNVRMARLGIRDPLMNDDALTPDARDRIVSGLRSMVPDEVAGQLGDVVRVGDTPWEASRKMSEWASRTLGPNRATEFRDVSMLARAGGFDGVGNGDGRWVALSADQIQSPYGVLATTRPRTVDTPALREIAQIPEFQQAYAKAQRVARIEGTTLPELGDGPVPLQGIDYMKRYLDRVISSGAQGEGLSPTEARALRDRLRTVLAEVDDAVPVYGQARAAWSGGAREQEALQLGRDIWRTRPEDAARAMAEFSPEQRQFTRRGIFESMAERIESVSGRRDLTKARPLDDVTLDRQRLRMAFEDDDHFKRFQELLAEEVRLAANASQIMGGSQTADKLVDLADLADVPVPELLSAGTGNFSRLLGWGAQRAMRSGLGARARGTANELTSRLLVSDPLEMAAVLEEIAKRAQTRGRLSGAAGRGAAATSGLWAGAGVTRD